ncbi:alpha/beta fold hydrolase [Arcicella aquatica]|uniref:Alpha/beta fold hydrolase n=1 Tax=Arcicella aquatica TaxID=217141 RepID=A0ABU5QTB3_9BACT|nr:alpha/beta fold hydrolase [Arcicella aquatica]MEA5260090.1 alpha/beta fold hydrolase [Arcicella aquatica]
MPIIQTSYRTSHIWKDAHFSTIYPSTLRKVTGIEYDRERLELWDGDFLDLDWSKAGKPTKKVKTKKKAVAAVEEQRNIQPSKSLAILSHGFLGNTTRPYLLGGVKAFNSIGWDVLAWNHRGLSGEKNRLERMTIHGGSDELEAVVNHALVKGIYEEIVLVGYSKGANIALKYAGEKGEGISDKIKKVVAISCPTDLQGSIVAMGKAGFYAERFKVKLLKFLKNRWELIDSQIFKEFEKYKYLEDFTNNYIAPLHGMKDAEEYYEQCAAMPYVDKIRVPSFILNAKNDPVLSESCAMLDLAKHSDYIFSEYPNYGGHCGFYLSNSEGLYYGDKRMLEFVEGKIVV